MVNPDPEAQTHHYLKPPRVNQSKMPKLEEEDPIPTQLQYLASLIKHTLASESQPNSRTPL